MIQSRFANALTEEFIFPTYLKDFFVKISYIHLYMGLHNYSLLCSINLSIPVPVFLIHVALEEDCSLPHHSLFSKLNTSYYSDFTISFSKSSRILICLIFSLFICLPEIGYRCAHSFLQKAEWEEVLEKSICLMR